MSAADWRSVGDASWRSVGDASWRSVGDAPELGDAIAVRREAVRHVLLGSLAAVKLLSDQVRDEELDPKERRAAAIALCGMAGLSESAPKGSKGRDGVPDTIASLLSLIEANDPSDTTPSQQGYVHDGYGEDPFGPIGRETV